MDAERNLTMMFLSGVVHAIHQQTTRRGDRVSSSSTSATRLPLLSDMALAFIFHT
jgi:hypothetical protein